MAALSPCPQALFNACYHSAVRSDAHRIILRTSLRSRGDSSPGIILDKEIRKDPRSNDLGAAESDESRDMGRQGYRRLFDGMRLRHRRTASVAEQAAAGW